MPGTVRHGPDGGRTRTVQAQTPDRDAIPHCRFGRGGITPPRRDPSGASQGDPAWALHALPSAGTGKALGRIGDTGWFPADCALAVGETDLVAAVNGEVAIFNRSGKRLGAETLNAFFGSVRGGLAAFDPRAVFDPHSERFFVIAVARSDEGAPRQSMVLIAVRRPPQPVMV
ncbi:MAG: hypothetical protein IPK97_08515 [Ahniella sp.]|nr:hypothetical protein [Ahniella sp.]